MSNYQAISSYKRTKVKPMTERAMALVSMVLIVAVLGGCQNTVETEGSGPSSDRIRVLWNPAEGVLPTPTDLVRDDEGATLAIPIDEDASQAQQAFSRYLNTLDGYPLTTPIRIPVSGPINENSLGRGVTMVRFEGDERVSIDTYYDADHSAIVVEPREPLDPGQRYVVGVRGYRHGVVGQEGEWVIADTPFYLVRSPYSVADHPNAVPGDSDAERTQRARDLADLQDVLASSFEVMERHDVEREEIAVVMEFTTTSAPAVKFDSRAGDVPLPNDLLADPEGDGLELPIDDEMDDEERLIREVLSQMDGFSISGAATIESTHRFAPGDPSEQAFRLFTRSATGGWTEVDDVERGRFDDGSTVWLRPDLTLEPGREYVYVVTDELRSTGGLGHRAQPLGAMLTLDAELVSDEGRSELDMITDEEAQRLEPIRQRADELLKHLEMTENLDRHDVAAAVPFRTATAAETLLQRRADLYERNISTAVTDIATIEPSGGAGLLLHNVESVVTGKMSILDYHDPKTRRWREDGEPRESEVEFIVTLPDDVAVDEALPVVLFGHGLMTSRELLYLIANKLASAGYAAFAMDFPYHGSRAVCLQDGDCDGDATCDDQGGCHNPDGSPAKVREVEVGHVASFLEGTIYDDLLNYPINSGDVFINMESLPATRDNFAQGFLDLNQAVRVIQGDELQSAIVDETGLWLGDEIVYLGMSLGGILGSGLTAIEPEIDDFVLNVPAADLTLLIEHSVAFGRNFELAIEERGIERDSDAYFSFMNAARWMFDPIDPLNLVQHVVEDPLSYEDPETGDTLDDRQARVLIQMAEGDRVVPNVGTEVLSERMNVAYKKYSPALTDHAFLFDPTMLDGATRDAQDDLIEFFDER